MRTAIALIAAAAFLLLMGPSPYANAKQDSLPVRHCAPWACASELVASNRSGDAVLFSTFDRLLPGDRNERLDLYEQINGQVRMVSKRSRGRRASRPDDAYLDIKLRGFRNGRSRAIFSTSSALLPTDRDQGSSDEESSFDIYEFVDGRLRLLTHSPAFPDVCGGEPCDYNLLDVGADDRTVYLSTSASLASTDQDSRQDIYALTGSQRTLVTGGSRPGGGDSVDIPGRHHNKPAFRVYEDGSVVFTTRATLATEDHNSNADVYRFKDGETHLLSPPRPPGLGNWAVEYRFSDSVPGRIFSIVSGGSYETPAPPGLINLYVLNPGGEPELVYSADPGHTHVQNAAPEVVLDQPDGTIYFRTSDRIDPLDTDDKPDLYAFKDGVLTMISIGPRGSQGPANRPDGDYSKFAGMGPDGLYFLSDQRLVYEDRNFDTDLYRFSDGEVSLVSTDRHGNPQNGGVDSVRMLGDGGIVMSTRERWVPADRNRSIDLYLRRGSQISLISASGRNQPRNPWDWAGLEQYLGDDRFAFNTDAPLVAADGNDSVDVYLSKVGAGSRALRLVSRGKLEIFLGPPGRIDPPDATATFFFRQPGPQPRYICSLDERPARKCKSPVTYRNLKSGNHSFAVASIGRHGLGRTLARSRTFKVSKYPPPVSLDTAAVSDDGNRAVVVRQRGLSGAKTQIYRTGTEPVTTYDQNSSGQVIAADPEIERILISTKSRIEAADDDATTDFYGWWGSAPFLFPNGENIFGPPESLMTSDDLKTVAFESFARLDPADIDYGVDVYSWGPDGYRLFSGGTALEKSAGLAGFSGDGSSVVFRTHESLLPADTDGQSSLYFSDGNTIHYLVRDGIRRLEDGELVLRDRPIVAGVADDGSRVVLEMPERLVSGDDSDYRPKVYDWTPGGSPALREIAPGTVASDLGNPWVSSRHRAISDDALTVLIRQAEDWRPGKLLRSVDGAAEPVYPAKPQMNMYLNASSTDLSVLAVDTGAALDPADLNHSSDTYLLTGNSAIWLTRQAGGEDEARRASVVWLSPAGDEALFFTGAPLLPGDHDRRGVDFYRYRDGELRLLSPGKRFPDRRTHDYPGTVLAGSDGSWIYFTSAVSLLPGDPAGTLDIYRLSSTGKLERMPAPPAT